MDGRAGGPKVFRARGQPLARNHPTSICGSERDDDDEDGLYSMNRVPIRYPPLSFRRQDTTSHILVIVFCPGGVMRTMILRPGGSWNWHTSPTPPSDRSTTSPSTIRPAVSMS